MPPEGAPERLQQLLRTGQTRGYVLYDEIDGALPPGRECVAELDNILSVLASHAIEVVDEPRTEDSIPDESFFDQGEPVDLDDLTALKMYLRELRSVPRLSVEQEKELARQIHDGGMGAEDAEERLIEANLWIALATAMHFLNRGLSRLDLVQEGNVGLMRAVREYNPLRAYGFSTYATWWVRRAIQVAVAGLESQNG